MDTLARLEPVAGTSWFIIQSTPKCAAGEKIPERGIAFIKDCKNEFQTELVEHLIEEGPLTHMYVISDTVEHAIRIDGSAIVTLGTAHKGLKWSGTPG